MMHFLEQIKNNELVEAGVVADSEAGREIIGLIEKIDEKTIAIDAASEAEKESAKAVDELAKANEKAAQDIEDAWEERRETLSDFFFEFAKDGMSAFETLYEGFKAMIIKMIADAAANTIILGVTTVLSGSASASGAGGTAAGGTGAGGTGSSLLSLGSSGLTASGFQGMAQGTYASVANSAMFQGTQIGNAAAGQAGVYGSLGSTGALAYGALNIGAGYVGSLAGQAVFGGETTGIGSGIGGAIGSFWGPIGTMIGSFLGEGLETALGNILGFGGTSNNRVFQEFEDGKGKDAFFTDSGSHSAQFTALAQVAPAIEQFAQILGGTFDGSISASAKHGLEYGELRTTDPDEFLNAVFRDIVSGSELVNDALEEVILAFDGTAEEFAEFALAKITIEKLIEATEGLTPQFEEMIRTFDGSLEDSILFAQSLTNLVDIMSSNAVDDAAAFAAENFAIAQDGVLGRYNLLTEAVTDSMVAYDGSASSIADLNNSMVMSKSAAFQLALEIGKLSESLVSMFESSASSIREQLMSESQLTAARTAERDATLLAIQEMTNPEGIAAAAKRVNELNDLLFRELSEEDKKLFGADFAEFADEAAVIVKEQLDGTLALVEDSQEALMTSVGTLLTDTGKINRDAADVLLDAAKIILDSAKTPVVVEVNVETSGAVTG